MKFSVITICYNSQRDIEQTLHSINNQTFKDYEHIVIDGDSSDNTLELVQSISPNSSIHTEKDKGIYDAINKGIKKAIGEFIVLLHSGDVFYSANSLEEINNYVNKTYISLFSVEYHHKGKKIRDYKINGWELNAFEKGIMPPHLGMIIPTEFYRKNGLYSLKYSIASDFELSFRYLYKNAIPYKIFPKTVIIMSVGGKSSSGLKSNYIITKEIISILSYYNISLGLSSLVKKIILRLKERILFRK